jgi:hypothetical protein
LLPRLGLLRRALRLRLNTGLLLPLLRLRLSALLWGLFRLSLSMLLWLLFLRLLGALLRLFL